MATDGHEGSFGDDKILLHFLVVITPQLYEYTKHWIVYFNWVNVKIPESELNKAVIKINMKQRFSNINKASLTVNERLLSGKSKMILVEALICKK